MPYLATLLGNLFSGLVGFFSQYLTKRLSLVAAAVIACASLTTLFFAAIIALISALIPTIHPSILVVKIKV